ncbi:MAG: OmpA family protein [Leptospirales bacterium]|nr:OmpA family protein [Leptospirales bacterium]
MKKIALICATLATFFFLACGTTPDVSLSPVAALNKQLERASLEGFEYKSSEVPSWRYDAWAKASAPVVQQVLAKVPDGYVLQVTGHADSSGPEHPVGNKPGNIKISTDRASAVHSSLRKSGVTSDKLTFKGVGSSQPLAGVRGDDSKQRRVSFVVVPK